MCTSVVILTKPMLPLSFDIQVSFLRISTVVCAIHLGPEQVKADLCHF
jgi:hypothetical protein